jgi:hypothetical protein
MTQIRLKPSRNAFLFNEKASKSESLQEMDEDRIKKASILSYVTEEEWERQKRSSSDIMIRKSNETIIMEEDNPLDDTNETIPDEMEILAAKKQREIKKYMQEMENEFIESEISGKDSSRHVREEEELEELDEGE